LRQWEITQFHHYNEKPFKLVNDTVDPFKNQTRAELDQKLENIKALVEEEQETMEKN